MACQLPYAMQHTASGTNDWCWAAVAVSTQQFLWNQSLTQCELAGRVFGDPNACSNPGPCDKPYFLEGALFSVNCDGGDEALPLDAGSISQELAAGFPVLVRIEWAGGGGHFIAITGVLDTGNLHAEDPQYGWSEFPYDTYLSSYRGSGTWSATYRARRGNTVPQPDPQALAGGERDVALRATAAANAAPGEYPIYFASAADLVERNLDAAVLIGYRSISNQLEIAAQDRYITGKAQTGRHHGPHVESARVLSSRLGLRSSHSTVRFLEVPSLGIVALWIRRTEGPDTVFPLDPTPTYLNSTPYTASAFFDAAMFFAAHKNEEIKIRSMRRMLREAEAAP